MHRTPFEKHAECSMPLSAGDLLWMKSERWVLTTSHDARGPLSAPMRERKASESVTYGVHQNKEYS